MQSFLTADFYYIAYAASVTLELRQLCQTYFKQARRRNRERLRAVLILQLLRKLSLYSDYIETYFAKGSS